MASVLPDAYCHACGLEKPLSDFRVYREAAPTRYFDFCKPCEEKYGFEALYERFAQYTHPEPARFIAEGGNKALEKQDKKQANLQEEARKDVARRELARRHIIPFVLRFMPTYKVGWVHHDICRRLERFVEAIERGEFPRLILAMPPRAGKSLLASDFFPSWALGKHPDWEVISASYAVTLPEGFSRKIKDRINDPAYKAVFDKTKIREDASAVQKWHLTAGGGYRAAGVGTGITGMGAHIAIVDDPFKDDEEAQSETIREKVKNWFTSTLMTRLAPSNGVLIIATRWHDDDLSGACLTLAEELRAQGVPDEEIDNWELVSYPALAEADEYLFPDGTIERDPPSVPEGARLLRKKEEALHPERYDAPSLRRKRNTMPSRQWNAMYQQNPVPDDGEFFTKDMFRHHIGLTGTTDEYQFITAWDVAIGESRRNDWTVGVVCAIDAQNHLHVVDMVRGRMGTMEIVYAVCDFIEKYDCSVFGMEHGQIKMTLWPLILEEMRKRKLSCSINDDLKPVTDKETRATPLRGLMQTGRVWFPQPSSAHPWVEKAIGEMLRFPAGANDDIVDALAWAARMYRTAPRPRTLVYEQSSRELSWKDRLEEFGVNPSGTGTSFMSN